MKSKLLFALLATLLVFSSCKKDTQDPSAGNMLSDADNSTGQLGKTKQKTKTKTYQEYFIATSTITPTATGVFNPGSGYGKASRMEDARICFNQQVVFYNGQPMGSVAAPVNQFFSIKLANEGIKNVPSTVSSVTYDDDGNSVWFTSTTGTSLVPVSSTRVNFYATLSILGGTGKYNGASGSVQMTGYFNPQLQNQDAIIQTNGTITYKDED